MYTREPVTRPPYSGRTRIVSNEEIDELKNYVMEQIANIDTGDIDLSDYVTQDQLLSALNALDIDIDLSTYATKEELQQAIASIDLSGYATTAYVDNAIANIPSGKDGTGGGGSGGREVYSTEETEVGTWIDGKPIYRKKH